MMKYTLSGHFFRSGNPFAVYAAIRLWEGYLRAREPRDREKAAERFRLDIMGLISPLEKYSPEQLLDHSITDTIRQSGEEMKMDVWYPARCFLPNRRNIPCAAINADRKWKHRLSVIWCPRHRERIWPHIQKWSPAMALLYTPYGKVSRLSAWTTC